MTRLNITLPDEIAKKLAEKPNKSRFIAMVLHEEFDREMREKTERLMQEGYTAAFHEDENLDAEWEKTSPETWE
ncbi:hypothetical protein LLG96_11975 [bacterium]|nr:hypothetical protein [bacterium]